MRTLAQRAGGENDQNGDNGHQHLERGRRPGPYSSAADDVAIGTGPVVAPTTSIMPVMESSSSFGTGTR